MYGNRLFVEPPLEESPSSKSPAENGYDAATETEPAHKGNLLMDATVCTQDVVYPTDLNLLNDARGKTEELIDVLQAGLSTAKPRTYREVARKK